MRDTRLVNLYIDKTSTYHSFPGDENKQRDSAASIVRVSLTEALLLLSTPHHNVVSAYCLPDKVVRFSDSVQFPEQEISVFKQIQKVNRLRSGREPAGRMKVTGKIYGPTFINQFESKDPFFLLETTYTVQPHTQTGGALLCQLDSRGVSHLGGQLSRYVSAVENGSVQ